VDTIMVLCKKCNNRVAAQDLRMDLDEKMMICPLCIKNKKIHKEIQKDVYHKEEKPMVSMFKKPAEEEPSRKARHVCKSCGYKFTINLETKIPKNCPYCNEPASSGFGY